MRGICRLYEHWSELESLKIQKYLAFWYSRVHEVAAFIFLRDFNCRFLPNFCWSKGENTHLTSRSSSV